MAVRAVLAAASLELAAEQLRGFGIQDSGFRFILFIICFLTYVCMYIFIYFVRSFL